MHLVSGPEQLRVLRSDKGTSNPSSRTHRGRYIQAISLLNAGGIEIWPILLTRAVWSGCIVQNNGL